LPQKEKRWHAKEACQKKRKRGVTMSEKKNKYIISRDDKREREPML